MRPVALLHLSDYDAGDRVQFAGVEELDEEAVEVPGRQVDVLEEENAAVELDLPGRAHRLHEQPQAAADERRGRLPSADRPHVRIVGVARDLAGRGAAEHRGQRSLVNCVVSASPTPTSP